MKITEVVAALIWQGDKFMICQRPAHKARGLLWEFVGGKVEPGETKEQALIRECQEELAITLSVGDTFMSVVFNHLDTPMRDHNVTTGGHTDKFSVLGIHATLEELSDVNADWKRSHETVCEKMSVDPHFIEFKKRLRTHRLKRLLSRKNVLFAIALIAALILLGVVASYIDKKSNTTIWSDRFWTVISAGVVVYFLQQITPKR